MWSSKYIKWFKKANEILKTVDGKDIELWEFNYDLTDDNILTEWVKHFRNHYCRDEDIDDCRNGTGLSRKNYLINLIFPDKSSKLGPGIRSGDFSEILVADYLEFILHYWVPRTKFENKSVRDESKKGCDIVGIKFMNYPNYSQKDELIVYESKSQLSGTKADPKLQNAIDHSSKDYLRKAETLNAIKNFYRIRKMEDEKNKIQRFQNLEDNPYIEKYSAAAIFDNSIFDKELIKQSDSSKHNNKEKLSLIVFNGNDLMNLVHELYQRAADEA